MRLLEILKENPALSYRDLSQFLRVKPSSANSARWRLRRLLGREYVVKRLCPNCLSKSKFIQHPEGYICSRCGAVYPIQTVPSVNPYGRGPVDALHWGNNLGSAPDYAALQKQGVVKSTHNLIQSILQDTVEKDNFVRSALEELMNILEPLNLSYRDTHDLGTDLRRRIKEWRANNFLLTPNSLVKEQLIAQTLLAAALDKPRLTGVGKAYLQLITLKRRKMDPFTASCVNAFFNQAPPKTHVAVLLNAAKAILETAAKKRKRLNHLSEEEQRELIVKEAIRTTQTRHDDVCVYP